MSFTGAAGWIAALAVVLGGLRLVTAIFVLFTEDPSEAARMVLGSRTTGQAIDQGLFMIVVGVCIGVLTEISERLGAFVERNVDHN